MGCNPTAAVLGESIATDGDLFLMTNQFQFFVD